MYNLLQYFFLSLLNRLLGVLACSRALRVCVLACSRALRVCVFACLCVCVLACSRAWCVCVLTCLCACVLVFLRAWRVCVLACLNARTSYDACLACLPLTYSRFCLIIYFVCMNQGFPIKRKLLIHVNLKI